MIDAHRCGRSTLDEIVRANDDDLLRYFELRMSNPADAAEAFGEMLLTAWRKRRKMPDEDTAARMWLFTTARNVLYNARRSLSRRSEAVQRFVDEARSTARSVEDDAQTVVREAITQLARDDAELIRLVYWDGLSIEQSAGVLCLNPSTARSRLSRIRRELGILLQNTELSNDNTTERPH
ncbi:RNA polymerase sigma factor [Microbacterium sp. P01]|uniref:RNA polymerase sigma factor n=1 Tax=Microbacterium sp. P01 TaxID=3366261 RepID=UPI00366E4480